MPRRYARLALQGLKTRLNEVRVGHEVLQECQSDAVGVGEVGSKGGLVSPAEAGGQPLVEGFHPPVEVLPRRGLYHGLVLRGEAYRLREASQPAVGFLRPSVRRKREAGAAPGQKVR